MFLPRVDFANLPKIYEEEDLKSLRFLPSVERFFVEEIPMYRCSGEGEHLFVSVRKRGHNTRDICRMLASHLEMNPEDIGVAGLKDRHATTTQWLSIPAKLQEKLDTFAMEGVEIVERQRHRSKLRTGHLLGNHFRMVWSELSEAQEQALRRALGRMEREGMPNFFGPQRFGRGQDNHLEGQRLLVQAKQIKARWRKRMMISAYQSACFNDLLAWRIGQCSDWLAPIEGDWMRPFPRGGALRSFPEGLARELARDAQEADGSGDVRDITVSPLSQSEMPLNDIKGFLGDTEPARRWVPTGVLLGSQVEKAEGLVGEWESALWEREGVNIEAFQRLGSIATGTRRLIAVWPWDVLVEREAAAVSVAFSLPAGSYASVLCAQIGCSFGSGREEGESHEDTE